MTQGLRASKGSVNVLDRKGYLYLLLPRTASRRYFNVNQKQIALGIPNTPENWKIAENKAQQIQSDLKYDCFDDSLERYKIGSHLTVIQAIKPKIKPKLIELWKQYIEYKLPNASPKTINSTYEPVTSHIQKCSTDGLVNPLKFRLELLQVTTESQARRTLMQISAACKWGLQHKLVDANPFEGMYKELTPKQSTPPMAFSPEERDRIIEAFKNDDRKGMNYRHYAPFVEFLFLTGCRPSEAIGLRWGSVLNDCSLIHFHESIVEVSGRLEERDETKTGIARRFRCTPRLEALLRSIKPENPENRDLVFPSPTGRPIGSTNFSDRAWSKILESLGLLYKDGIKMTPYNCRDTFITLQAYLGKSSTQIAKWVGNSSAVIEKKYLDKIRLEQMMPEDI